MMVFLSGVSYSLSGGNEKGMKQYMLGRFLRIIVPTWIFMLFYFVLVDNSSLGKVLYMFSLLTPWYVWIMRVFFVIALLAPFMSRMIDDMRPGSYFLLLAVCFIINEILCVSPIGVGGAASLKVMALMNVPYLLVFSIGYISDRIDKRYLKWFFFLFGFLFVVMAFIKYLAVGEFIPTQLYKYPPSMYYLSYAMMCITLLWSFRFKIEYVVNRMHLSKVMSFIGSHTLWIYFWHIVFLNITDVYGSWFVQFILVMALSAFCAYLQHRMIWFLEIQWHNRKSKYLRILFDG